MLAHADMGAREKSAEDCDDACLLEWEARLAKLRIVLPAFPSPGGNYVPAKTVGQMVICPA